MVGRHYCQRRGGSAYGQDCDAPADNNYGTRESPLMPASPMQMTPPRGGLLGR
jgi:hypothetical protein